MKFCVYVLLPDMRVALVDWTRDSYEALRWAYAHQGFVQAAMSENEGA